MKDYLDALSETLDQIFPGLPSDVRRFERAFGNILYIHLSRANKVAQAISLVKAEQSGLWHVAPDGTEIERLAPPQDPHYDLKRIQREVAALEAYDAAWDEWFKQQKVSPLRVQYETLAEDPVRSMVRICEALGVEAPETESVKPGVAKLANEISLDWIRRYDSDIISAK